MYLAIGFIVLTSLAILSGIERLQRQPAEVKQKIYSRLNRPIHIIDYDPGWPTLFEQERQRILTALGHKALAIEHFGSTAIPGLAAKPVIDIAIAIRDLTKAPPCIDLLEGLGYIYEAALEAALPFRRFLWKGTPETHTHHIHMAAIHSPEWEQPLLFRDYLRAHPEAVQQYQELKRSLAGQCGSDMDTYIAGKTSFVESVLKTTGR